MYDPNRAPLPPDMMGITSVGVPMPDLQRGQMTQAPRPIHAPAPQGAGFSGFGDLDGRALADAFRGWVGSRPDDPRSAEFQTWLGQIPGIMQGQVPAAAGPAPSPVTPLPSPVTPGIPQGIPQVPQSIPQYQRSPVQQGFSQYMPSNVAQQSQGVGRPPQSYMPQGIPQHRSGRPASGGFFGTRKGR